jgi:hypothetical protein
MPDPFLALPKEDQAILLKRHAPKLDMMQVVVEKDIWVCWALEKLFNMPDRLPMAFKGGTSLSKVYKAINRFSEDIDVTLDYRGFVDPIRGDESRSEITRLSERLKGFVLAHVRDKIKPYFEAVLSEQFGEGAGTVELNENGEKLYIYYPSAFDEGTSDYVPSSVLVEFGGRNITEPNEAHKITPYLSADLPEYIFPEAIVTVLALQRTYWEKATLAHVECNRPNQRLEASRLSRHWYDLYQMSGNLADLQSPAACDLLGDVVRYKKIFFHYGYADYDSCLSGALRLVPEGKLKKALEADFMAMVAAGMFYAEPPSFEQILARLTEVQELLNISISNYYKPGLPDG